MSVSLVFWTAVMMQAGPGAPERPTPRVSPMAPVVGSLPTPAEERVKEDEAPKGPATSDSVVAETEVKTPAPATPPEEAAKVDPRVAAKTATSDRGTQAPAEVDVASILGQEILDVTTTSAMENEVETLRKTLDALVGEGDATAKILNHLDGNASDLEGLGVSPERAEQIRSLSNDVRSLRAKLQLMHYEGRSGPSADELRDIAELDDEDPVVAPTPELTTVTGDAIEESASPDDASEERRSLFPEKEALLAFHAGDDATVVSIFSGLNVARLPPQAQYAYGCALVNRRDFVEARVVFGLMEALEERPSLRDAASRQLVRIAHLENGIVSLHPLLKEGIKR